STRGLLAQPHGVAVATEASTGTHVVFFSQQGELIVDTQTSPGGTVSWFAANNAGEAFVGYAPRGSSGPDVSGGLTMVKLSAAGKLIWSKHTPRTVSGAGTLTQLGALPDGGIAYQVGEESLAVLNA